MDVQQHIDGVVIQFDQEHLDENLPGELQLANDEANQLEDMLREARFVRRGLQPLSVQVSEIQKGDIIPSLGLTVRSISVQKIYTMTLDSEAPALPDEVTIHFDHNYENKKLTLPDNLEITVHRRIQ